MRMINSNWDLVDVEWDDIINRINWITRDSFGADLPKNWEEIANFINDSICGRLELNEFWEDDLDTIADELWEAFWQGEFADAPVVEFE